MQRLVIGLESQPNKEMLLRNLILELCMKMDKALNKTM